MSTVNVREARERIAQLLDEVAAGEVIVILRRGQPAARLIGATVQPATFLDRRILRDSLPPMSRQSAQETVRALRDAERY